jgi:hypothetical protein
MQLSYLQVDFFGNRPPSLFGCHSVSDGSKASADKSADKAGFRFKDIVSAYFEHIKD